MCKKKITQIEVDSILNAAACFPQGAPLEKIFNTLSFPLTRRTLQRRLTMLVKKNLLYCEGKTRARLYRLPITSTIAAVAEAHKKDFILLSTAAQSIQFKVSQPVQTRIPVSYHREFLDKYRPNETFYLPMQV